MSFCSIQCSVVPFSATELKKTELQIHFVKTFFADQLAESLKLMKVSAPLFVEAGTGINDDLNGTEAPVTFSVPEFSKTKSLEIVQSLAKWKRVMLKTYDFPVGEGLYTDMRAIRPFDKIDATHSAYVDQWDWEMVISRSQRNLTFLKNIVEKIYAAIRTTEEIFADKFSSIEKFLPNKITFIHAEELLEMYPHLSSSEREKEICRKYGAVFLIGIGGKLKNGQAHDGRAPDYDDWSTESENGYCGLNGDILVWHPELQNAFELSSMGIRVDADALTKQLALTGCEARAALLFHSQLLSDALPLSIGGGIGQSRLAMFLLRKSHIAFVQAAVF